MILILALLMTAANPGVIIVDNVWFYGNDHQMRILNTADTVEIVDRGGDRYRVMCDTALGDLDRHVMIDLDAGIAEHELFVFGRGNFDGAEYETAARLLEIFVRRFDGSSYAAEALYYLGQSMEMLATRPGSDSVPDIERNERTGQNFYAGDAYRRILDEHPASPYASKAQYRLINIFRTAHLPWPDSIGIIEEELAMWHAFCRQYADTDEHVLGLTEAGFLNRVLFELTADAAYQDAAAALFNEIIEGYPATVHAAYATVHLAELAAGERIYNY